MWFACTHGFVWEGIASLSMTLDCNVLKHNSSSKDVMSLSIDAIYSTYDVRLAQEGLRCLLGRLGPAANKQRCRAGLPGTCPSAGRSNCLPSPVSDATISCWEGSRVFEASTRRLAHVPRCSKLAVHPSALQCGRLLPRLRTKPSARKACTGTASHSGAKEGERQTQGSRMLLLCLSEWLRALPANKSIRAGSVCGCSESLSNCFRGIRRHSTLCLTRLSGRAYTLQQSPDAHHELGLFSAQCCSNKSRL